MIDFGPHARLGITMSSCLLVVEWEEKGEYIDRFRQMNCCVVSNNFYCIYNCIRSCIKHGAGRQDACVFFAMSVPRASGIYILHCTAHQGSPAASDIYKIFDFVPLPMMRMMMMMMCLSLFNVKLD
jgi:hypothetical protein